jgi:hypothetical protein
MIFAGEWPLVAGHYWTSKEHRLLRGPFATREVAKVDAERIGPLLINVILDDEDARAPEGSP